MPDKVFFDTNIMVYAAFNDGSEKTRKARKAIKEFSPVISVQVLNELSSVFLKKRGFSSSQTHKIIDAVCSVSSVCQMTPETVHSALDIHEKYGFSYYDSLILAAALENDCSKVFSEDMQDGQIINEKLKITSIFSRGCQEDGPRGE